VVFTGFGAKLGQKLGFAFKRAGIIERHLGETV
jgi:hypothetical protein